MGRTTRRIKNVPCRVKATKSKQPEPEIEVEDDLVLDIVLVLRSSVSQAKLSANWHSSQSGVVHGLIAYTSKLT